MPAFSPIASLAAYNPPPLDRTDMLVEGLIAGAVIVGAFICLFVLLGALNRRKKAPEDLKGTAAEPRSTESAPSEGPARHPYPLADQVQDSVDAAVEQELKNRFLDRRITRGKDIEDGILESFVAVARTLEANRVRIYTDPYGFERELRECVQKLDSAVRDLRACVVGPDSRVVRTAAFTEALERDLAGLKAEFGAQFDVRIDEQAVARLTDDQLDRLRAIAKEASANALRHGKSRIVSVALGMGDRVSQLVVQDNGRGFAPDLLGGEGKGLALMRTLAAEVGGRCEVVSRIGNGARVVVSVPWGSARAPSPAPAPGDAAS